MLDHTVYQLKYIFSFSYLISSKVQADLIRVEHSCTNQQHRAQNDIGREL